MGSGNNTVVSSESERLILVDADDRELGSLSKGECHDGVGVLHRAFSVFVFNSSGSLLLQQRSANKRLWPLYWSNSCCSHPRSGESMQIATRRRLEEELRLSVEPEFVYKFSYRAQYGDIGAENELCSVFLARTDQDVVANETEIATVRYVSAADLEQEFEADAAQFTPWFRMEWQRLTSEFAETLRNYCTPE